MAGLSIGTPYTIASLANPLDRDHGRIQTAQVHSVRGGTKRKRHEIAVGVDGEGVNIYNVQSQSIAASYALPPQSYLCCPPCSIYLRSKSTPERRTYVVLRDGPESHKRQLVCFTEHVKSQKMKDVEFTPPKKSQCALRQGDILSLDLLPGESDEHPSVVVNRKDGRIELVAGDLSGKHQASSTSKEHLAEYEVESATIVLVDNARKGMLKSREDIIAQLNTSTARKGDSHLLCRMVRTDRARRLELHNLRNTIQSSIQSTKGALNFLTSYQLPLSGQPYITSQAHYDLHASSGMLYQLLRGKLTIYDLSGTVPRLATDFGSMSSPIDSFVRLTSSSVLTFSHDTATVYEISFGSVQASLSLWNSPLSHGPGNKRKRANDTEDALPFHAISAFTDINLVIGTCGQELIALQLNGVSRSKSAAKSTGALLRDVMGKGSHKENRNQERNKTAAKWEEWTAKVDALIASDDIEGLERLVANKRRLGQQRMIEQVEDAAKSNVEENVDPLTYDEMWPLPEAFDQWDIDKRRVLYLLAQVFGHGGGEEDSLEVLIPSLKLLEWLALTGLLSIQSLMKAFQSEFGALNTFVLPGDVMKAISRIDDDFQLMHDLLSLPVHWEAAEVVQALKLVIQSLDAPAPEATPLALPAPPQPNGVVANGDVEMADGNIDSELELESEAVENELNLVLTALNSGLELKSDTLRVVISRLHSFPQKIITALMRSMMSQNEIIFFIHILRIELADGGWTSNYIAVDESDERDGLVSAIEGDEEGKPSDQAIKAIGDLLNCAIDAIGTSGWLVGLSSSALGTDELIHSLRAEVSAGLEGCYQANSLEILLMELEKCARPTVKQNSHIVEVRAQADDDFPDHSSLLPLESRVQWSSHSTTTEKSKRAAKARARARDNSRRVGKYSFERIRI